MDLSKLEDSYQRVVGGYSEGGPHLPIPNRIVKPFSADGTTQVGE